MLFNDLPEFQFHKGTIRTGSADDLLAGITEISIP